MTQPTPEQARRALEIWERLKTEARLRRALESGEVTMLGLSPRVRLHLAYIRLSNRLFCLLADHCPRAAEMWALHHRWRR